MTNQRQRGCRDGTDRNPLLFTLSLTLLRAVVTPDAVFALRPIGPSSTTVNESVPTLLTVGGTVVSFELGHVVREVGGRRENVIASPQRAFDIDRTRTPCQALTLSFAGLEPVDFVHGDIAGEDGVLGAEALAMVQCIVEGGEDPRPMFVDLDR